MPKTTTSIITLNKTATSDASFRICDASIPFYDINVHVESNDCKYGTPVAQEAIAVTGSVISFRNGDIRDIWFKNRVAGNNTKIIIVATVPTDYVTKGLFEK